MSDNLNELAAKVLKVLAPLIAGALLTLWYTSAGDHIQIQQNKEAISAMQADIKQIKDNYATNKRVDDVVTEMRTGFSGLNSKMDQVIKIILERK